MKKLKLIFILIIMSILVSSCDTGISFNGRVIDKITNQPVAGVKISVKDQYFSITDSLGSYNFHKFHYGYLGFTEILFEKKGYKPVYFNLDSPGKKHFNEIIKLEKSEGNDSFAIDQKYVKAMFYFNRYVLTLFGLFTFIFVCVKKKISNRVYWLFGILLVNLTFYFSITDFNLVKFLFLNGPVYLSFWSYNPYSLKIVIPTASFLFWVLYFFKREIVIKGSEVDYDVPTSTLKIKDKEKNYKSTLVEVFSGTMWEAEMVKSMLDDAEIETFLKDEIMGTLNPFGVTAGGAGAVTVVVSSLDFEEAKKIVSEYEKNINQP